MMATEIDQEEAQLAPPALVVGFSGLADDDAQLPLDALAPAQLNEELQHKVGKSILNFCESFPAFLCDIARIRMLCELLPV